MKVKNVWDMQYAKSKTTDLVVVYPTVLHGHQYFLRQSADSDHCM